MTVQRPGEIPCPSCSRPLALPVEAVLSGQAIVCNGCGLELTAQRETSHKALNALARWYEETAEARKAVAAARPPEALQVQEADRRARRPRR